MAIDKVEPKTLSIVKYSIANDGINYEHCDCSLTFQLKVEFSILVKIRTPTSQPLNKAPFK